MHIKYSYVNALCKNIKAFKYFCIYSYLTNRNFVAFIHMSSTVTLFCREIPAPEVRFICVNCWKERRSELVIPYLIKDPPQNKPLSLPHSFFVMITFSLTILLLRFDWFSSIQSVFDRIGINKPTSSQNKIKLMKRKALRKQWLPEKIVSVLLKLFISERCHTTNAP